MCQFYSMKLYVMFNKKPPLMAVLLLMTTYVSRNVMLHSFLTNHASSYDKQCVVFDKPCVA